MRSKWYKSEINHLTRDGKKARKLVLRICNVLSKTSNGKFTVEVTAYADFYEGHIFDNRKIKDTEYNLETDLYKTYADCMNENVGMIFFGGHFNRKKYKDAKSKAWISLLEDCIGIGELKESHTLTSHLKDFGPKLDFNCKSIDELELKLKKFENHKYVL